VSLLLRLFTLVAVALLPAIAIQSYDQFDIQRLRQSEVQEHALGLARLAAAQQLQIVDGIHQVLIALSELPAIKTKDSQACSKYLLATKQRYPAFHVIVVDMNGQSICTATGESGNVAGRADFVNATSSGHFVVGQFSIGVLTGRQLISFALPFYDDEGRMAGAVITALNLDWLAEFVVQLAVPSGAAIAIRDRNGTYLVRYPDNARFVGKKILGDHYFGPDHSGTIDELDVDGVERIVGYSVLKADAGALLVTIGLDKSQAFGQIQHHTRIGILLIVLSTLVVLVLTWLGTRRFIQYPLRELVEAANRWRLGDYTRRVDIRDKRSEIAEVGAAFNSMADALKERAHELSDARENAEDAKEKAEQAAARITTIFESMADCVVIVDPAWNITYLNEKAKARLCGERDLIGANLCTTFPDAIDAEIGVRFHEAISEQRLAAFETFCRDVWYDVHAFASGEGIAVLFRDITDHKHAIEERRLVEEQLHQSQKMEAVGQLTGGVAHDFNNLLMVISGNLELIESGAANKGSVQQFALAARKAADRGASLIAQLLAFSRRQKLDPKPVRADVLIQDFQRLIHRAVGEGCEVELVADKQLWTCHVDPTQLQTAILNLTLNARDAMPNGGTLTIKMRNIALHEGAIVGVAAGSYIQVSVSDTGCGMTREALDRAFEPFFTTKEVGKGTGLGLSMVYGFVRQSGGHVAIESAIGVGTTVNLYLPIVTGTLDVKTDVMQIQHIPEGSGRVLVVEDDEDVLSVTSAMLTQLGYQVVSARTAKDAIVLLKGADRFDLLFSDVVMPQGITGVELTREARRLGNGIKILLTSGYAEDVLRQHGATEKFPIIGKPFSRVELAQHVQLAMRSASRSDC
jgi:signal transduction histidine kinase/CheY-like chemotaxis protein